MSSFKKAERKKAKLRLAISGPSNSGKTYSALRIAKGIGGNICMIDTEHGSGELYSNEFTYDVAQLYPPFTPDRYIELIREAERAYDVLIIDSLSHAWSGQGGILDMHADSVNRSRDKNSFTAWKDVTPKHVALMESIVACKIHVIATMRSKTAYEIQEDDRGKKRPVKIGLEPIQRADTDYEFTFTLEMERDTHIGKVSKARAKEFDGLEFVPSEETGEMLKAWLDRGADPVVGAPDIKARFDGAANANDLKIIMEEHKRDIDKLSDTDKTLLRQAYAKRKDELSTFAERLLSE